MDWPTIFAAVGIYIALDSYKSQMGNSGSVRLSRLEKRLTSIETRLGIERDASSDDVIGLLLDGKKIPAIKLYRQKNAVGLKEAKDAVEQMERDLRQLA